MKPKLTTENKAKIFALYWGQEVAILNDDSEYAQSIYCVDWEVFDTIEHPEHENDFYLELRPLSSITDEDLLSILPERFNEETLAFVSLGIKGGDWLVKQYADELRLLGIAIDWCGWSVEELVKEGVFVLKE